MGDCRVGHFKTKTMKTKEYFLQERENEIIREMEVREAESYDNQKQEYFDRKQTVSNIYGMFDLILKRK